MRYMLVYAGIDEAGYGPMFGPLCVACTCFAVEDCDTSQADVPDLWRLLNRAVCRKTGDSRRRIAVEDSKKLKGTATGTRHPLADLERGVLSFLACCIASESDAQPFTDTCAKLFNRLGPGDDSRPWLDCPWYATSTALPVTGDANLLRIDTARLRKTLDGTSTRVASMACRVVDVGDFNRGVKTFGNKAGVNLHHALSHVEEVRRLHPKSRLEIVIDRQGGRTHYRRQLQDFWPNARLKIEDESEDTSRYRLTFASQRMAVTFARRAEESHLPVALASMTAKYLRELLMLRLNRYFCGELPELKPTAGYVQDGRRFLADIEPVIRRLDLPRSQLIRRC